MSLTNTSRQDALLERLSEYVEGSADIGALVLVGSFANRAAGALSDLDLFFITYQGRFEARGIAGAISMSQERSWSGIWTRQGPPSADIAGFPQIWCSWRRSSPDLTVVVDSPNRSGSSQAILNCSRGFLGVSPMRPMK
jgi:hypothetical protein